MLLNASMSYQSFSEPPKDFWWHYREASLPQSSRSGAVSIVLNIGPTRCTHICAITRMQTAKDALRDMTIRKGLHVAWSEADKARFAYAYSWESATVHIGKKHKEGTSRAWARHVYRRSLGDATNILQLIVHCRVKSYRDELVVAAADDWLPISSFVDDWRQTSRFCTVPHWRRKCKHLGSVPV